MILRWFNFLGGRRQHDRQGTDFVIITGIIEAFSWRRGGKPLTLGRLISDLGVPSIWRVNFSLS